MKKKLASWLLKSLKMKITNYSPFPDKCVIAAAPHTSNWDFPMGVSVRTVIGEDVSFIGKSGLFRWPYGFIFRWLGGVPVDRSKSNNFVEGVATVFAKKDKFKVVIAPEGTRSKVEKLKSGFYYIAKTAGVPLILCAFDWAKHEVRFSEPYYTTDDKEKDFSFIRSYFSAATGLIPENGYLYDSKQQEKTTKSGGE